MTKWVALVLLGAEHRGTISVERSTILKRVVVLRSCS
jgi:hypothetical protein